MYIKFFHCLVIWNQSWNLIDKIYLPQTKYFLKLRTITNEVCAVWRGKKKPNVNVQDTLDLILGLFLLLGKNDHNTT